jgi:hypothetical protein
MEIALMSTELRGKVKQKVWVRPYCTDESDPLRLGQKARKDFKRDSIDEEGRVDVVAPDVFEEAFELIESNLK